MDSGHISMSKGENGEHQDQPVGEKINSSKGLGDSRIHNFLQDFGNSTSRGVPASKNLSLKFFPGHMTCWS